MVHIVLSCARFASVYFILAYHLCHRQRCFVGIFIFTKEDSVIRKEVKKHVLLFCLR